MNIFEFIIELVKYSSETVTNLISTFLIVGLIGVLLITMLESLAKFKLFTFKRESKNKESDLKQEIQHFDDNKLKDEHHIYDLLVDAYDRYLKKNNKTDTDQEKEDI